MRYAQALRQAHIRLDHASTGLSALHVTKKKLDDTTRDCRSGRGRARRGSFSAEKKHHTDCIHRKVLKGQLPHKSVDVFVIITNKKGRELTRAKQLY